ncbi:MAG: ribosome biogenesis GTPase Der [bacterium]|nr:ribosome biogenesis GTPase Der [bacterium]
MKRVPVVAIVGRSNVGKSSLFNALARKGSAVVDNFPGVTRDRNYCMVTKFGFPFTIVDTGGLLGEEHDELHSAVRHQAELAISEADLVVCLFDGMHGINPQDPEIVSILRKSQKPVIWVVNKCETPTVQATSAEFYALGVKELLVISAAHGHSMKEFIAEIKKRLTALDLIMESAPEQIRSDYYHEMNPDLGKEIDHDAFPTEAKAVNLDDKYEPTAPITHPIKIAIVGKPNSGKSTVINKLLGEDRLVVSNIPGTTRDSIEISIKKDGEEFILVDTAGLRKKARVEEESVERFSNMRTLRALATCDVAVLLIDAQEFVNEQDQRIAGLIHERGRGLIIAINKWDLVEKDHTTVKDYERAIRATLKFAPYAPIIFISGLTGRRCPKILEAAKFVYQEARKRVQTAVLNKVLSTAFKMKPAPAYHGDSVKMLFATQTNVAPPEIVLFMDHPRGVDFSYERYLKNIMRTHFGFEGSDIKLVFKKRRDGDRDRNKEDKRSKNGKNRKEIDKDSRMRVHG